MKKQYNKEKSLKIIQDYYEELAKRKREYKQASTEEKKKLFSYELIPYVCIIKNVRLYKERFGELPSPYNQSPMKVLKKLYNV